MTDQKLADALDRVASQLSASTAAARDTAAAVRATERRRRRNTGIGIVAAVIAGVVLVAVLVTLLQVSSTQDAIKDCTDLTRRSAECARQAQQNTQRTINAIAQGQLTASYVTNLCADETDTAPEYQRCVAQQLDSIAEGRTVVPPLRLPTP